MAKIEKAATDARLENVRESKIQAGLQLLALLCCCLLTSAALAGPPFITDDPQPVDFQHWEFYLASMDFHTAGDWFGTGPHVEINYGVVPNVQLHIIAPLGTYDSPSVGRSHYGYGDTELGVKYRFIQETKSVPMVGVFPLLEVPTGSERENLGNGHLQAFLPVWLQKTWGGWTAYGGGGYGINSGAGHQNWYYVGGLLQKQVTKEMLLGAEIYHRSALNVGERDDTAFNIGTIIDLSEQHHLLFSAGRSFSGPTDFQCYVAYQFTFDNNFFHSSRDPHP